MYKVIDIHRTTGAFEYSIIHIQLSITKPKTVCIYSSEVLRGIPSIIYNCYTNGFHERLSL